MDDKPSMKEACSRQVTHFKFGGSQSYLKNG